jgi:hypothetical protein
MQRKSGQQRGGTITTTCRPEPEGNSQTSVKSNGRQEYLVGYCKPPIEHQFKPGQGGRRKGARNKLGEDFLQALAEDFERHGTVAIERVRIDKPQAYLKIIASLLPKDLNLNVSKYDGLTDEQLIVRLRTLTKQVERCSAVSSVRITRRMMRLDRST